MDEASFSPITGIDPVTGVANFGDRNPFVTFFRGQRLNQAKSSQTGVPVYDPVDMIKIIKPGERDEIHRVADDYDKNRFREQWKAYCDNIQLAIVGTPLETLLPVNPELVAHLKALRIATVQQLSELPDSALGNIQFGHDLREKAKRYLAVAEKGAEYHRLQRSIEDKDAENLELRNRLAALEAKMTAIAQAQQPAPGQLFAHPVAPSGFAPALQQPSNSPAPPPLLVDDEEDEPVRQPRPVAARRK